MSYSMDNKLFIFYRDDAKSLKTIENLTRLGFLAVKELLLYRQFNNKISINMEKLEIAVKAITDISLFETYLLDSSLTYGTIIMNNYHIKDGDLLHLLNNIVVGYWVYGKDVEIKGFLYDCC